MRTLVDMPAGVHVCIYAGAIHTDEAADHLGKLESGNDAYFCDMDLIDTVHRRKMQQEDEERQLELALEKSKREQRGLPLSDSDEERMPMDVGDANEANETVEKSAKKDSVQEADESVRFFSVAINTEFPQFTESFERSYFKRAGKCGLFVIDARKRGNIGRFFNHSCSANIVIQNVFVDTHDLRLPW